ncbi:hypothetical protein QCA50_017358 [Cerrena zonata]|uniref:WSC domain-containing protein n=1 Tax=Cerrena zonata TaxID=2478898 RepID=A0AAW0FFX8_9APHY
MFLNFVSFAAIATIVQASTAGPGQREICRLVCPDTIGQIPLVNETLNADNSATGCVWFENGFGGPQSASFDSNGVAIPGSVSDNMQFTPSASQYCTLVADGWSFADDQVCITDSVSSRILKQDTRLDISVNSPEECTAGCAERGFTFAGVEFANECHCGNGFTAAITPVPHTQCNKRCPGNSNEFCGSGDRIQVFKGPDPPIPAQLPAGWSIFSAAPCARDSAARMFTDTLIAGPVLAARDTPAACVSFCIQNGFTKAGVEGGDECYCGNTFRDVPIAVDPTECNLPCQGALGVTCGGNFAIQLYTSS